MKNSLHPKSMGILWTFVAALILAAATPGDAKVSAAPLATADDSIRCMLCEEFNVDDTKWHGFVSGSDWICDSEQLEGGENTSCRACGGSSECHVIVPIDSANPTGGLQQGKCHVGCTGEDEEEQLQRLEAWIGGSETESAGTAVLVVARRGPITFDEKKSILQFYGCNGKLVREWKVPPAQRERIVVDAV
jgi:hypothetical protein